MRTNANRRFLLFLLAALLACAPGPESVTPSEAYDVPPPPGSRTLSFELSWAPALGQEVTLHRAGTSVAVDVVDVNPRGTRHEVTGYASEGEAGHVLASTGWRVTRGR